MWEFLASALSAIPSAATNRYSLIAYALAIAAYMFSVWRVQRNKNLLENLQKLSPKDRLGALELEMGGVRLASGISPEQWVRSRIHKYYLLAFFATCAVVVTVFGLAVFNRVGSPLAGFTYVGSMTVIENQYQQINQGKELDEDLKQRIAEAINFAAREEFGRAIEIIENLPEEARVPAVLNDLGIAYAAMNDDAKAEAAFQQALRKDADFEQARANLDQLEERKVAAVEPAIARIGNREIEPNNDIFHPNAIALDSDIASAIADPMETDYYTFKSPPDRRDVMDIVLENMSTTLRPQIVIYNSDRQQIDYAFSDTPAGNTQYVLPVPPDTTFFVQVQARSNSVGAYKLTVRPRKAYDSFEPNDDIFHPTQISLGRPVEAGITEPGDTDYYQFTVGAAGKYVIAVENRSTTLIPQITVFDRDRNQVDYAFSSTASGNTSYTLTAEANAPYRVQINQRSNTSGDYTLTVTLQ